MKKHDINMPVGQFIVAALGAKGWSDREIARLLRVPGSVMPALKRGEIELRQSSVDAFEDEMGTSWAIAVVSTLGKADQLTKDTLQVLKALDDADPLPRVRARSISRTRVKAA